MAVSKGSAIYLVNPHQPLNPPHLFFVISEADSEGKVLLVNMTTDDGAHDKTCILNIGEHPKIKHLSIINYVDAISPQLTILQQAVDILIAQEVEPMPDVLLKKIQEGAKKSPYLAKKFQRHFQFF